MSFTDTEKKQIVIFAIVAYGITYVLGFLMWFGYEQGMDLSLFPDAQMFYPAAGVMIAYLLTGKGDKTLPRIFYIFFVVLTAFMIFCTVASVLMPKNIEIAAGESSMWLILIQLVMMGGSLVFWILLLVSGRQRREAFGLGWKNGGSAVLLVLLFIGLLLLRLLVGRAVSGQMEMFGQVMTDPSTWIMFVSLFVNFFLVVVPFFGEEYGWRYYLQPLLQKRFGLRGGVLVLGVVWALWHLPIDFFYYTTPDMGLAALTAQFITCITLGIFMAYAYMKTENIWVPVMIHFLNNNLTVVFSGSYSADALQGQAIYWKDIPIALILNFLIFGWFIFLKPFREGKPL